MMLVFNRGVAAFSLQACLFQSLPLTYFRLKVVSPLGAPLVKEKSIPRVCEGSVQTVRCQTLSGVVGSSRRRVVLSQSLDPGLL